MKTILVLSILFSAIAWLPTFAELTDADLDKIRLIVKASENSLKEHTKSEIESSETRMKSYVDAKIESVKTPIAWLIGILVAMIAIIGLPLAILTIFLGLAKHKGQHTRETDRSSHPRNRSTQTTANRKSLTLPQSTGIKRLKTGIQSQLPLMATLPNDLMIAGRLMVIRFPTRKTGMCATVHVLFCVSRTEACGFFLDKGS